MTPSLEQKKLTACAELDEAEETTKCPSCVDGYYGSEQDHWRCGSTGIVPKYIVVIKDYATSLDAIVPVVIKWCGGDNRKKAKFEFELCEILYKSKVSNVINAGIIKSDYLLLPTPSKILDALLLAAGKMPVE